MPTSPRPRGPKGSIIFGNLLEFAKDPLQFLTNCANNFGDVAHFQLGYGDIYLISNPTDLEYVLMNKEGHFSKGYQQDPIMRLVLGNGLVTSEGEFWLKQRRLSQPAFQPKRIASYAEDMINYGERLLESWEDQQVRNVHADMMEVTMHIAAKTLFQLDVQQEDAHDVSHSLDVVMKEYNAQLTSVTKQVLNLIGMGQFPTPSNTRLKKSVERLDQIIFDMIDERRRNPEDRGDLLSVLIAVRDEEDGTQMTDQQLRDELITLFLAGHETTANTLSWVWYLLAQHPEIDEKLSKEIESILGDRPLSINDLPQLKYVEYVIKEALRLYPTVWWISRVPDQDVEIGNHLIPAGSEVAMSQWVMHRDPRFFQDPLTFKPERWENSTDHLPKYAYFPFGGGPRICIGNHFAMMEAKLLLVTVARQYRMELVEQHKVELEPSITLRPKHGIQVKIRKR